MSFALQPPPDGEPHNLARALLAAAAQFEAAQREFKEAMAHRDVTPSPYPLQHRHIGAFSHPNAAGTLRRSW